VFRWRTRILIWAAVVLGLPLLTRMLHGFADLLESRGAPVVLHRGLRHAGGGVDSLRSTLRRR
jgi:hypothetical protein